MNTDTRRPRILVCESIANAGLDMLRKHADVDVKTHLPPGELLDAIPDYDALIVRGGTQVTAEVIQHGLQLKAIARAGTGLENIDIAAVQAHDIEIIDSPDTNAIAVAEHTLGLLLALARRLPHANASVKAGKWKKNLFTGTGLAGKTLGIIGFGHIGRQVAIRARAFGMKILANQIRLTPELRLEEEGVEDVDLVDLLQAADFVTLHVPSTPETQRLIGQEQLALMKPGAYLLNTARGELLDEAALLQALDNGYIAGAALDVFAHEPAPTPALVQHPRVIATPHIGADTVDAQHATAVTIAEKLIALFQEVEVESVLPLCVVPLARVFPHEHYDPKRVGRLANRLAEDMFLSNPPIVMAMENNAGYMVLDGATRTQALKQLDFPHAVVQVISSEDGLALHTWFHVIRKIVPDTVFKLLDALPEVSLYETTVKQALEAMFDYDGLCYLQMVDGRVFLVRPTSNSSRLEALNSLTNTYIEAGHVSRTLDDNVISLKGAYPDMAAVVIFPEYTVQQVMQAAQAGRMFPAGITRFVIPGRILRLNADLHVLKQKKTSLREKNRWLHELLTEKEGRGKIRFYEEPVFLLDE